MTEVLLGLIFAIVVGILVYSHSRNQKDLLRLIEKLSLPEITNNPIISNETPTLVTELKNDIEEKKDEGEDVTSENIDQIMALGNKVKIIREENFGPNG